eukprot:m.410490 g.410490  ORF g.410490 m.410490 type:complete len:126 (-) comp16810_c0_seq20:42-419(-)
MVRVMAVFNGAVPMWAQQQIFLILEICSQNLVISDWPNPFGPLPPAAMAGGLALVPVLGPPHWLGWQIHHASGALQKVLEMICTGNHGDPTFAYVNGLNEGDTICDVHVTYQVSNVITMHRLRKR